MYPFDIHTHTSEHSACSYMRAEELIARGIELGLAGLIITDHHYQWPAEELQAIADRICPQALVVLSAYEVTTSEPRTGKHAGDLLVFGDPCGAMRMGTPYDEVCAIAHEHDALVIAAHPFRDGVGAGDRIFLMDIDGIEVLNQNHSPLDVMRARQAVRRAGLLGLAGSDAHRLSQVAQFLTVFQRPVRSMTDFLAEVRAQRYRLQSNRPDIR